jgi:uncharacterized protein GlcG (DUF336 family)
MNKEGDFLKMMNLKLAKTILSIAVSNAKEMGRMCSIALVDENGWLVALHRMDGAPSPTAEIARDKAWTAAVFRRPSAEVSAYGDPRALGFGLNAQNWNDRLTTIPGGLPIWDGDLMIGAIGASGAAPEEDVFLCQKIIEEVRSRQDNFKL